MEENINADRLTEQVNLGSGMFIILCNLLLFIPYTIYVISIDGGSWGFGYLILPHSLIGILFLIPALMALKKSNRHKIGLLLINVCGAIGSGFWLYLLISIKFFE